MSERKTGWSIRGDQVAFALTVALALLPSLLAMPRGVATWRWWALAGCGLVFIAGGFIEYSASTSRWRRWQLAGGFALQSALLAGIFTITRLNGMSVLSAFPLVGQAIVCLPAAVAGIFVTVLYGSILAGSVLIGGMRDIVPVGSSVLAGFGFVVVFTRNAVREKEARAEAERLSSELTDANAQLRSHAAYVEELAMTRERNRVAREIHDSLGHALTTMAVQLEVAAAMQATDPARAAEAVRKAHALAGDALADVRRSVGTLRAETVRPLPERLRQLATSDERLTVNVSLLGEARSLAADVEHGLFRVAQEGLTNVRKHAAAKSALLTIDYREAQRVTVSVADDGQGCVTRENGHGLTGLRERAGLLGGVLSAANRPEGGFLLRVEVPG